MADAAAAAFGAVRYLLMLRAERQEAAGRLATEDS
jgi:hypothetical protein